MGAFQKNQVAYLRIYLISYLKNLQKKGPSPNGEDPRERILKS
jgi:hypothetical protein